MGNSILFIKLTIAAICGFIVFSFAGAVEGKLLPVVSPASLSQVDAVKDYSSRIWGSSERLRNCDFSGLNWSYSVGDRSVAIIVSFETPPIIREDGPFEFGPWLLQLSPEELKNSKAIALHNCHPLYKTESLFFDGSVDLN